MNDFHLGRTRNSGQVSEVKNDQRRKMLIRNPPAKTLHERTDMSSALANPNPPHVSHTFIFQPVIPIPVSALKHSLLPAIDLRGRIWKYQSNRDRGPHAPPLTRPHSSLFTLAEVEFLISCHLWRAFGFFPAESSHAYTYLRLFPNDRYNQIYANCFP